MRWKGLIALAVAAAAWILVTVLFLDRWIESGLEAAGSAAVGAKVEIDGLDFRVSGPSIEWRRLQVTDPKHTMRNVLETGRTAFRMNPAALLRKRIVIEEMTLADARSGTPRAFDGAIPKPKRPPKPAGKPDFLDKVRARFQDDIQRMPVMRFDPKLFSRKLNLDSLVVLADLKTVGRMDSLKTDASAAVSRWESFSKTFRPDADLKRIQADFKDLDPRSVKTLPEVIALWEKARSAQKSIAAVADTFRAKEKAIRSDIAGIASAVAAVDDWVRDDYRSVAQKAKLPDLSVRSIAKLLAGGTVVAQADKALGIYQSVRKVLPKKGGNSEKQTRPRFKGQDIHFDARQAYPTFHIRKLHVSGQTGPVDENPGIALRGEAFDITSQPWVIGRPTVVDLSGETRDARSVSIQAVLDHVTDAASDSFHVRFDNASLNNVAIQNSPYLPSKILAGKADLDLALRFRDNAFLGRLNMNAKDLNFDFSGMGSGDLFVDVVRQVIGQIGIVTLRIEALDQSDNFRLRFDSNLDERVSQELKRLGSKALEEAEARIMARLNAIKAEKLADLDRIVLEKRKAVDGVLNRYGLEIGDTGKILDGKVDEFLKEIDRRKKGEESKLKDKAKKFLDGVIK
jgi:uncharacterized protein (TIGR03545 family)